MAEKLALGITEEISHLVGVLLRRMSAIGRSLNWTNEQGLPTVIS